MVVGVNKEGRHGSTEYRHYLACGHSEVRKRWQKGGNMTCFSCSSAPDVVDDETRIDFWKMQLARRLGVQPDDIELIMDSENGPPRVQFARITLDGPEVRRLLSP